MKSYYKSKPEIYINMNVTLLNGTNVRVKEIQGDFFRAYGGQVYALCKDKNGYYFY